MTRRLTDAYCSLRQNFTDSRAAVIESYKYNNEVQVSLIFGNTSSSFLPFSEFIKFARIRYVLKTLDHEMNLITDLYQEHTSRPTFNDDIRLTSLIDKTYRNITRKIQTCYDKTLQIKNNVLLIDKSLPNTHRKLLQAALSYIFKCIRDYSSSLGIQNRKYRERLDKINVCNQEYFSIPMEDDIIDVPSMKEQTTVNSDKCQGIVTSVDNLNQTMRDLSLMVFEQGSLIDRVDHHVELASTQVQATLKNLIETDRKLRIAPWKITIGGLCIVSLLLLIIILIKKF
ncbi:Syntaxin-16 [Thelohanellus kitauei]|uniref:Syntaxin-16 n=1 Tax=Thelohanellus kitauei TaxID=669202 RepID=A0A0C2MHU7_THEKT|nr:Syntaxin-16 [Thelohanellus kitauei]